MHLAFAADLVHQRLLVIPPHVLEHRTPRADERVNVRILDRAIRDLTQLRAGKPGLLALRHVPVDQNEDALMTASRIWHSVTDYRVTRYAKRTAPEMALAHDIRAELVRLHLPTADVTVTSVRLGTNGGLSGRARLEFRSAVRGLILIGRTRHLGGGLFWSLPDSDVCAVNPQS